MSAPVPPTLPPGSAAAATSTPSVSRGTVVSLPPNVSLAQGQALAAQVVAAGNGQIVLATHLGPITVQSSASLPAGASVLLQVQAAGEAPQVSLHLPQSAGTVPVQPARNAAAGGAPQPQPTATTPVTTQVTEGSVVQAVVTRALPAVGALPEQTQTPAAPAASAGRPGTAAGPAPTLPAPALSAGSSLALRIVAVSPPGGEIPSPAPLASQGAARLLAATVTGQQPGGASIATMGTAEIVLSGAPPLPAGSRLLLEVLASRPPLPGGSAVSPAPFAERWDALAEALAILHRADPALARTVADTLVPNPGPRLAGSMLFFLSAVLSGDIRRFLDAESMRHLLRGPGGPGGRLSAEIGRMQRTATDATGQEWRLFLVPVLTEDGLEQLRFLLRKDEDTEGKEEREQGGTRFLVEVEMSRLGPFQFDGLSRRKHLDLVVRTRKELPPEMRDEIRAIFGNTVTALGLTGTIAFRVAPRFEPAPVEQPAERAKDLSV